jgi:hypothetical protein
MASKFRRVYVIILVVFSIGLLVVLSGCPDNGAVDRIIGFWAGIWITSGGEDFTNTSDYKADGTFTNTIVDIPQTFPVVTYSGTYVHDNAAKTIAITVTSSTDTGFIDIGYTETFTYSLSADNNTLTVTGSDGSGTYTRQ